MTSPSNQTYRDWEEAALAGKFRRAVSEAVPVLLSTGKTVECEIIKSIGGDAWWTYAGANGVKIQKATTAEVDRMRRWKPW